MKTESRRFTGVRGAALVLCILLIGAAAQAQDCEIPLFVQQSLAGANVMVLADNSGSMNSAIYHLDYDADHNYTGTFFTDSTYFVAKSGVREPSDFNPFWATSPSVTLVASDNGEDGRYTGNYLNWLFYHASDAQRAAAPTATRIQVLKAIINEIVNRSKRLNFGLTVFQYDHGGNIIGKCGVNPTSLLATVNGLTANAWTPLGEAMETILDYFAYDGPDAAIQVPCQYNFCLVITDGLPTMDLEVSGYLQDADGDGNDPGNCASIGANYPETNNCSDYFDDVTYYMAHEDLRPDLDGDQTVSTYVVGFHENGKLLQEAAQNGDGLFFHAENAVELYLSIEYAIQDILRRISAGSAVAVVSTERGTDDRLYRGKFMPIDWDGYLECYALPYSDGDTALWEAGELLRARGAGSRRLFTALGRQEYTFNAGSASNLRLALGAADDAKASDLINWARGYNTPGLRNRGTWLLGDIVHSTPVVVGAPPSFVNEESYQQFYNANKDRRRVVYVGANDGMLHAFDADDGQEVWGFVPEFALKDFASMADSGYCHTYTCDQTVTVKDVRLGGTWKTVLVSGGGRGGASVFALDITDPDKPEVLWQNDLPNGKDFNSEVEIIQADGEALALVGGGLDETDMEAWLYCYGVESGDLKGSLQLGTARYRNKTTRPASVDYNLDGETDLLYVADMKGTVWRIQLNGSTSTGAWTVTPLYTGTMEITSNPVAAFGNNGTVHVYFGTGAYLTEDDMVTAEQQYFLCVNDYHDGSAATMKSMVDQTTKITEMAGDDGWYVELWNEIGERVTEPAVVIAEVVAFSSYAPTQEACVAGGASYLYQMSYDDGGLPDNDDITDPADRSVSLGQGIASYPVVDLAAGTLVVQSSDASIKVENIAAPYQRLTVRAWQEQYTMPTEDQLNQ